MRPGRADAVLLLCVVGYAAYTFATGSAYTLRVFSVAGAYALMAIGYQFIFGQAGALALSQGAFMGVGAYASGILAARYGVPFDAALPFSVSLPMLLALLVALAMPRARTHYFALATLIVSQMALLVATEWQGLTGGANGLGGIGGVSLAGFAIRSGWPLAAAIWATVAFGASLAAKLTRAHRYAVLREHPAAAAAIGLDAGRMRLSAFLLSAGFAGFAGSIYAHVIGVISPDVLGFPLMVTCLTIVVVGGRLGVAGAIAGAIVITGLPEWFRPLRDYAPLAYGVVLLLVVIVAPGGLVGALRLMLPDCPPPPAAAQPLPATARASGVLLDIAGLSRRFGGVRALDGVRLTLRAGEVLGLIGPNGSGKTTLVNCVTGLVAPDAGRITFAGRDITRLRADRVANAGIARTFQTVALVDDMTALDSVAVARRGDPATARAEAMALLDRVGAAGIAIRPCGGLPSGARRRVEIARALALQPRLLLLDEPAAGLNATEQADLAQRLRGLARDGMALLVIEHDMAFLAPLVDRLACLDEGRLIADGPPEAVRGDARVIEAYLGTPATAPPRARPPKRAMPAILSVRNLEIRHGAVVALRGIDLDIQPGQAVALLGANGAGKTTLMKAIIGLLRPTAGDIQFEQASIARLAPDRRARNGIGYCPEGRRVFPGLTVAENLAVACWGKAAARRRGTDAVFALFPALAARRHSPAWQLSGGQQQMLALGRSLMNAPRLLLLDEPSLGLSPLLADEVIGRIPAIVAGGTPVLLAEQNAAKALAVCEMAYVLKGGAVTFHGPAAELAASDELRSAFLGG